MRLRPDITAVILCKRDTLFRRNVTESTERARACRSCERGILCAVPSSAAARLLLNINANSNWGTMTIAEPRSRNKKGEKGRGSTWIIEGSVDLDGPRGAISAYTLEALCQAKSCYVRPRRQAPGPSGQWEESAHWSVELLHCVRRADWLAIASLIPGIRNFRSLVEKLLITVTDLKSSILTAVLT